MTDPCHGLRRWTDSMHDVLDMQVLHLAASLSAGLVCSMPYLPGPSRHLPFQA